jgi:hypothetical protein
MNIEDIDFDNEEQVQQLRDQKVEIPVGVLYTLLGAYYKGGGEPDSYNDRLNEVMEGIFK